MLKDGRSKGFHGLSNLLALEIHYAFSGPRAHLLDKNTNILKTK